MGTDREKKKSRPSPSDTGTGGYRFSPGGKEGTGAKDRAGDTRPLGDPEVSEELRQSFDSFIRMMERPSGSSAEIPVAGAERRESGDENAALQREKRLPCNFPGLLKLLIPEKSFVPTSLAVRVMNLSANGALVEAHDRTALDRDMALANRFFEIKIAHSEIPVARGVVAWSDTNRANPLLGLSFFDPIPQLKEIMLADESTRGIQGPPPLPPPQIDAYAPRVGDTTLKLTGRASEALEVVAKGDEQKFQAVVVNGHFELKLTLEPGGENHFSIRSFAGSRKSRAVPVRVFCEGAGGVPSAVRARGFRLDMKEMESGSNLMETEFSGTVQQAERLLFRLSQLMASTERVSFSVALEGPGSFDARLVEALRAEGKMFAEETAKGNQAAKLLNEMM